MTFRGPIEQASRNLYYFCINKATGGGDGSESGEPTAPGPIPVGGPISGQSYGNGFATGSLSGKNGFTDFIQFSPNPNPYNGGAPRDGFAIYHVIDPLRKQGGSDNPNNFYFTDVPKVRMPPTSGSSTIQFEIDLTQIVRNPDGSREDPIREVADAGLIRFLQVNIIATNIAPADPTTAVNKMFDSMGDNRLLQNAYLTLNLQNSHWDSAQSGSTFEPNDPDVVGTFVGSADPSLDLESWKIELVTNP